MLQRIRSIGNCCLLEEKGVKHYHKDGELGILIFNNSSKVTVVKLPENKRRSLVLKFHDGDRQCLRHGLNVNGDDVHCRDMAPSGGSYFDSEAFLSGKEVVSSDPKHGPANGKPKKCPGLAKNSKDYSFNIQLSDLFPPEEVRINDDDSYFPPLAHLRLTPKDIMNCIDRHR